MDTLRNIRTHKLLLMAEGNSSNFTSSFDYIFGFNFYGGLRNVYGNGAAATTFDVLKYQ